MRLLIDGDMFKYRWAAACEYDMYICTENGLSHETKGKKKAEEWVKEDPTNRSCEYGYHVLEDVERLYASIDASIRYWKEKFGTDDILCVFGDGTNNFRYEIYPMYKFSRADRPKPTYADAALAYVKAFYPYIMEEGCEADDGLAMRIAENTICVSVDKDMLQVPGTHYDPVKDEVKTVSEKEGKWNLFKQVLTGDSGDDIPGLKGIGDKKATAILSTASHDTYVDIIMEAYEDGECELDWQTVGQLVYLKRTPDDSFLNLPEVAALLT